MWNACFESVTQIKKGKGSGCILAHCMGLGKTLQVSFIIFTFCQSELQYCNMMKDQAEMMLEKKTSRVSHS